MINSVLEVKLIGEETEPGSEPEPIAIAPGGYVIFNEPTLTSAEIDYAKETGIIKFNRIGQYSIKWWVATETTLKGAIGFQLQLTPGSFTPGCSPIKTGQVTGFGVADIETVGTTLSLVNKSTKRTMISRKAGTKAYLLITPIGSARPNIEAYHFNLSRNGSSKDIQVKNVIYRLARRASGSLVDLYLGPVDQAVQIDYRRLTNLDDVGFQGRRADSYSLGSFLNIDDGMYIDSNELTTVWLRQKDPIEDKYSTCVIRYLPAGPNASRVEVWVEWISEDVTYGDPL